MQENGNKAIVRRFVEDYQTGGDERALAELVAPDVLDHARAPGSAPGVEGVRQLFDAFRAAFPDFRARIDDQVAEDDKVVTRWRARHTPGRARSAPSNGQEVRD